LSLQPSTVDDGQRDAQCGTGVPRVEHAVVVEPAGTFQRLGMRPAEHEAGPVRPTGARGEFHAQVWYRRRSDRFNQPRIGRDAVVEEYQRIASPADELGRLHGLRLAVPHHREHTDRVPVQLAPTGDQPGAVPRLELVELAAVQDPGEDLPRVGATEAEQIVDLVPRRRTGPARRPTGPAGLRPGRRDAAHAQPGEPDRIALVLGDSVRGTAAYRDRVVGQRRLLAVSEEYGDARQGTGAREVAEHLRRCRGTGAV